MYIIQNREKYHALYFKILYLCIHGTHSLIKWKKNTTRCNNHDDLLHLSFILQKQPPEVFCKTRYIYKFCKIHRKTTASESLFQKEIQKETLAEVFCCELCEISKNTFFTEQLWVAASDLENFIIFRGLFTTQLNISDAAFIKIVTIFIKVFSHKLDAHLSSKYASDFYCKSCYPLSD